MVRTPDRFPGTREEEAILLYVTSSMPEQEGEFRYVSGAVGNRFYFREGDQNIPLVRSASVPDISASFVLVSATGSIPYSRVLVAGTGTYKVDLGPGGELYFNIDDNVVAMVSGTTFTGPVVASGGLSGSLQQTAGGLSYLVAQGSITIVTQSNGQVIISGSGAPVSGAYLTEAQHETLDTLTHDIVEDSYDEVTYSGTPAKVQQVITWDSIAMTLKIREQQYSYTGTRVTEIIDTQYDSFGTASYHITSSITYLNPIGNKVASITRTRSDA